MENLYQAFLNSTGVSTDTRNIENGNIFFALKGSNFNGNKYAKQAIDAGASLAIIDEQEYAIDGKTLVVDNVLDTLQKLANYHRRQLGTKIIGITGSNGKTTTKELLGSVLNRKWNTYFTKGNLNNHIGVPLSLLELNEKYELAVIEMGANHVGEIAELCLISEPDFGVITNIGKAHLEGFGGLEGVTKTKRALYESVKSKNGIVFVNADNELLMQLSDTQERVLFGTNEGNTVEGKLGIQNPMVNFCYSTYNYSSPNIETNLIGAYNFENMLAAVCVGSFFNVEHEEIKLALETYVPSNNRSQLEKTKDNVVIMDAYNANPTSVKSAIISLSKMEANNKFFILGDMLEMGNESEKEHQAIIDLSSELNLNEGVFVGAEFDKVCTKENTHFNNTNEVKEWLKNNPLKNYTVLVKGSRGINLDSVLEVL